MKICYAQALMRVQRYFEDTAKQFKVVDTNIKKEMTEDDVRKGGWIDVRSTGYARTGRINITPERYFSDSCFQMTYNVTFDNSVFWNKYSSWKNLISMNSGIPPQIHIAQLQRVK